MVAMGWRNPSYILDYGCGRGDDCEYLGCPGYDPVHQPILTPRPGDGWHVILCTYVLNTLPTEWERNRVVQQIRHLLHPKGVAYVTVRNDKANLNGWTKAGTWQGYVHVPNGVQIHEERGFRISEVRKGTWWA